MIYVLIILLIVCMGVAIGLIAVLASSHGTSEQDIFGKLKSLFNDKSGDKRYVPLNHESGKSDGGKPDFNKNDMYLIDLVSQLSDLMDKLNS